MDEEKDKTIVAEDLGQNKLINVPPAQNEPPIPTLDDIFATQEPTKTQQQATGIQERITELSQEALGEGAFRTQQEQALSPKEEQVAALRGQMTGIMAEAQAIPLQIQQESIGRGRTKAGVSPIQTARLRENAIKALTVNAALQAAQGNLAAAQNSIDRAVAAKYDPIRTQLASQQLQLEAIMPQLEGEQAARAAKMKAQNDERIRLLEEESKREAAELKARQDLGVKVLEAGGDLETMRAINEAVTYEDALAAAVPAFQNMGIETQVVSLDNGNTMLINTQTGEIIKSYGGAKPVEGTGSGLGVGDGRDADGRYTPEVLSWVNGIRTGIYKPSDVPEELKQSVATALNEVTPEIINADIKKAEQILNTINLLLSNEARMEYVVGPISSKIPTFVGASADYIAHFENLKSKLTLDNLGIMKGVLSDRDIEILTNAASPLRLNMSKEGFKNALIELQGTMTGKIQEARAKSEVMLEESQTSQDEAVGMIGQYYHSNPEAAKVVDAIRKIAPDISPLEMLEELRANNVKI